MWWLLITLYLLPVVWLAYKGSQKGMFDDVQGVPMTAFMIVFGTVCATPLLVFLVLRDGIAEGYKRWIAGDVSKDTSYLSTLEVDNKKLIKRLKIAEQENDRVREILLRERKELEQFRDDDPIAKMKKEIGL